MEKNPYQHLIDAVSAPDLVDLPNSPFSVEAIFEQLKKRILEFESNLEPGKEIGFLFLNLGNSSSMHVHTITYREPSLICFTGELNGKRCEIIQHINQLNLLLVATPKAEPDAKVRRIGFVQPQDE